MITLSGHTTPETAYLVDDYPYGYTLRCKIRYWLEYKIGTGYRLVSQTTNPKLSYEHWNKPKASTYARYGGVMVLNDEGHVQWHGLGGYAEYAESQRFLDLYGDTLPEHGLRTLRAWVALKKVYQEKLDAGVPWQIAGRESIKSEEALWLASQQKGYRS